MSVLISNGLHPEYVLDLTITAAINLADCYKMASTEHRIAYIADTQMAIASMLVAKSGIEQYIASLTEAT